LGRWWATGGWRQFPLSQNWKFFEMPLVGFLGFLPFALDCFVLFHFLAGFFTLEDRLGL